MSIVLEGIGKSFGDVTALEDVSATIAPRTLTALLGPSGCGKSTLLRLIAGFERPDRGRILIDGEDATGIPLGKRDVGFVFQNYALFPHLTVAENIAFGLNVRKLPRAATDARVGELLALIGLDGYGKRRPHELSGGQRQRVALARALAASPRILLLDEPFGALDLQVRKELRTWLRSLHEQTHVTTLIVTHDADEAMELSDQLVVLAKGRVQQSGAPRRVYEQPANPFVMSFLGSVNALQGGRETIYVRPHDFRIEARHFGEAAAATVERVIELGSRTQLELALGDGQNIVSELSSGHAARLGPRVGMTVYLEPKRTRSFDTFAVS
jgi:sulfate transport system ATP-binding protein